MKSIMQIYNLFQVVFNSWLFYKVGWLWRDHYDWNCEPVDYSYRSVSIHFFENFINAINVKLHKNDTELEFMLNIAAVSNIDCETQYCKYPNIILNQLFTFKISNLLLGPAVV